MANLSSQKKTTKENSSDNDGSFCSSCRAGQMNLGNGPSLAHCQDNTRNNFDSMFSKNIANETLDLEDEAIIAELNELAAATRSFSQVSLDNECPVEPTDQNGGPELDRNMSPELFEDTDTPLNSIGVFEGVYAQTLSQKLVRIEDNDAERPTKKLKLDGAVYFYDKGVQTEGNSREVDPWDTEFPPETELQEIEIRIKETPELNNKQVPNQGSHIEMKADKITKPVRTSMSSIVLNRAKRLGELANDIFRLSSYLDDIRKAVTAKEPITEVEIPDTPELTGYDSQFDFARQKRFGKVPIRIETGGNKSNMVNGDKRSQTRPPISKPIVKRLNNNGITPKRIMKQSTIQEAFGNKENQKKKTYIDQMVNYDNNQKSLKSSTDSSSMYNYNPYKTRSTKTPKP